MLENLAKRFRKKRLSRYKKRKVISSMTFQKRYYFIKFSIKVDDDLNPQKTEKKYEMIVPARAAFYAKLKAKAAVKRKIDLGFYECEEMTQEEHELFLKSKEEYQNDLESGKIVNN